MGWKCTFPNVGPPAEVSYFVAHINLHLKYSILYNLYIALKPFLQPLSHLRNAKCYAKPSFSSSARIFSLAIHPSAIPLTAFWTLPSGSLLNVSNWAWNTPSRAYLQRNMDRGNAPSLRVHKQSTYSMRSHPSFPFLPSVYVSSSYVRSSSLGQLSVLIPISLQVIPGHWAVWQKESQMLEKVIADVRAAVNITWCISKLWQWLVWRIVGGRKIGLMTW